MHTRATPSDSHFDFDLAKLKEYVETCQLDAIAITNHNIFDLPQFQEITSALKIPVFPGIEIDLEGGHLLLISDANDLADFTTKSAKVSELIPDPSHSISVAQLKEIFGDLGKYLLIPHYDKAPAVSQKCIEELSTHISAGEVSSPKKFVYCKKDAGSLVPVFFTDCRIKAALSPLPNRQTFITCGEITLPAIKACLRDKNKVSLSRNEGKALFPILANGQEISTGLTVILGERSSGKSYTLKMLAAASSNPKHIAQFSLVERDEEKDAKKFDEMLSHKQSLLTEEYLKPFQEATTQIIDVDIEKDDQSITNYLSTLKKHAAESERRDIFSKAKIFSAEPLLIPTENSAESLARATIHLIENLAYRPLIERHIPIRTLKNLALDLIKEVRRLDEEKRKNIWLNELMGNIQQQLNIRTASTAISNVDLLQIAINLKKKEKFEQLVTLLKQPKTVSEKDIQGFKIVAKRGPFPAVRELKNVCKISGSLAQAFGFYDTPYLYLKKLKEVESLPKSEYYRAFTMIQYKILNGDGYEVSGGERSEFNLLQEISDAQAHDILLIDEPESSFDNNFLNKEVNKMIKDISSLMPVVVVTHNNTVGASIEPDYLLYTSKVNKDEYRIYSGFPTDKNLKSMSGETLKNSDVILGCLEAGKPAYEARRRLYENLEN
jgi:ABC-type lipoprotein export system ATPase subunit